MEEADGTAMAIKSLHTRFLLSGCLIVLTTVACSVLAAWTLYRMSRGIHEALLDSQRTIEALATLTRALASAEATRASTRAMCSRSISSRA